MFMGQENSSSCVSVKKSELLTKLKENLKTHKTIFEKAQVGFRKEVVRQLDERLRNAQEGKKIDLRFTLPEPVNQSADYERVIKMLEMCTQEVVIVSELEFGQYVMDDWTWKRGFIGTNSSYTDIAG